MCKKNKLYYLFSGQNNLEGLCVCENEDSFESPYYQTGVYPLGTLLAKYYQIIKPTLNFQLYDIDRNGLLERNVHDSFHPNSNSFSFSDKPNPDPNVEIAFRLLLLNKQNISLMRKRDKIHNLSREYCDYIQQCKKDEDQSIQNTDYLNIIVTQQNDTFPKHQTYIPGLPVEYKNDIHKWLNKVTETPYIPELKKSNHKKLFNSDIDSRSILKTEWGNLFFPLDIYEISDEVDLILSSLTNIFKKKYVIKECPYCKNLFVTHRRNQKYCPSRSPKSTNKSCQRKMNEKRQNERNKHGIPQMECSLRTMYSDRHGSCSDEYNQLKDGMNEWKSKINSEEATSEEYDKWLKSHYKYKYKKTVS